MTVSRTILLGAVAVAISAGAAFAADDVIKARKEGFKGFKGAMDGIKAIVVDGQGDLADVAKHAATMSVPASKIVMMFPAGSDQGDTKALPAVWSDTAGFTAKAEAFEAAVAKLTAASATGDKGAIMEAFKGVGGSCKGCHDTFRKE